MNNTSICSVCGVEHAELPDIGAPSPYHWAPRFASDKNSLLTEDLCIIEGEDFFIRGVIHIPVTGEEQGFGWGVWVSLKKENFETYRELYDTSEIGPFFGWLCTEITYFQTPTLNLETTVRFRGEGLRPSISLNKSDHPLFLQQRDGISLNQAWAIVHSYIEGNEC